MVQRATLAQRHAHQRAARLLSGLADGLGHLAGLAVAEAHPALLVANHHQRREAEAFAALDHLGHAVDVHQLVLELAVALLAVAARPVSLRTSHVFSSSLRISDRP